MRTFRPFLHHISNKRTLATPLLGLTFNELVMRKSDAIGA